LKILSVFGTRPEAIKMAPVIKALCAADWAQSLICVTAQHRKMLDDVLEVFGIQPDYDLDIMKENQSLFEVTTRGLGGIREVLEREKPRLVLVQGDTTTTFVTSLAAFYLKIPVGHVEAGLRTNDKYEPFPEEINRRIVSALAELHFAPTEKAKNHLLSEGVNEEKIFVTGNTVIDALLWTANNTKDKQEVFNCEFSFLNSKNRLILVTAHRRESFGAGFKNICNAIRKLAASFPEYDFVYPVHLNPNVQKPVQNILNHNKLPNVYLIGPMEYLSFVYSMKKAYLILTDSGGIQEEAITLGKPILVMRNTTERPEGIKSG